MIIYEITTTVQPELIVEYEKYMIETHIPDLLARNFFAKAFFTCSGENRYRIQYHAHSQKDLDNYLQNEAEKLRADFLSHFPTGVQISRENWQVLKEF